ncbi:PREDICTED: acyl-CoA:lysophosphatidylglycerol acyltransferase 1-like [Vollenhovia emeryi]|uniref:acyl-CoA:lysophosphatidylglycerol acyltransferase 1-like n=1 Tax=Vollenhovia emeryi TaxID=411798 RepID=UPI0005F3A2FB|nr:PREDICTED: acyl-CoA:lysophosphatidylglycerol acyltransferase 1-like [Vollenhovia emeryi]XP_011871936.1 PREDICTED: acyl-CoA:lysophosphatidylglycerol acyltransferase 1-like [Vollenhovia emeryi]
MNNTVTLLKRVARAAFQILSTIYSTSAYIVWLMLLFPVKIYIPQVYWRIEGLLYDWLHAIVASWTWSAGYDIIEQGDDIQKIINEKTLVMANHQTAGDSAILITAFNSKPNGSPNSLWIMDIMLKFTNFGIACIFHQNFFIVSGREQREESLKQLRKHLIDSYIPRDRKWLGLFPEGGLLYKNRESSQKYAKKNNLPILENVALPRVGAMKTIMDTLGPARSRDAEDQYRNNRPSMTAANTEISWILDITIGYPDGKPLDLTTIVTGWGPPCKTVLFYRLFPSSVVPHETEQLTKWLYDRWVEKEALLEHFYKHGTFLGTNGSNRTSSKIHLNPLKMLVSHLFFMMSNYIYYSMLTYVLSCFW